VPDIGDDPIQPVTQIIEDLGFVQYGDELHLALEIHQFVELSIQLFDKGGVVFRLKLCFT
jgi:hypothetical protein